MQTEDKEVMSKLLLVLGVLVIITVVVFLGARLLSTINANATQGADTDEFQKQRAAMVDERIRPVGNVVTGSASAPKAARSGEEVVKAACNSCHVTGVLGAPKTGEAADWAPRMAQGFDGIVTSAINGKGSMPARGGDPSLTDDEMRRAVAHMLKASGQAVPDVETAAAAAAGAAAESGAASAAGAGDTGEKTYKAACGLCHDAGVAGAPKTGDVAAWTTRLSAGIEAMHASALKGKGAMPAKGGNPTLSDDDVKRAVEFMIKQSGGAASIEASPSASAAVAKTVAAEAAVAMISAPPVASVPNVGAGAVATMAISAGATSALAPATEPTAPVAEAAAVSPARLAHGQDIYQRACGSCHNVGLAGAPKLGDAAAWERPIAAGMASLYRNSINGKGRMPPKGGRLDLADEDVAAAVDFLVAQSR